MTDGKFKFVKKEYISQRLIGRLNIDNSNCSIGAQQINDDLIDRVIRQKESILEAYLHMIYQVPLKLTSEITRNVLSEIIENLAVATLLPIYYTGGNVPQTGVDPSSLAGASAEAAQNMIQVFITGHNMFVPGTNSQPHTPRGGPIPQPVVLPGECVLHQGEHPDTISRDRVFVGYTGRSAKDASSNDSTFNFDTFC